MMATTDNNDNDNGKAHVNYPADMTRDGFRVVTGDDRAKSPVAMRAGDVVAIRRDAGHASGDATIVPVTFRATGATLAALHAAAQGASDDATRLILHNVAWYPAEGLAWATDSYVIAMTSTAGDRRDVGDMVGALRERTAANCVVLPADMIAAAYKAIGNAAGCRAADARVDVHVWVNTIDGTMIDRDDSPADVVDVIGEGLRVEVRGGKSTGSMSWDARSTGSGKLPNVRGLLKVDHAIPVTDTVAFNPAKLAQLAKAALIAEGTTAAKSHTPMQFHGSTQTGVLGPYVTSAHASAFSGAVDVLGVIMPVRVK